MNEMSLIARIDKLPQIANQRRDRKDSKCVVLNIEENLEEINYDYFLL